MLGSRGHFPGGSEHWVAKSRAKAGRAAGRAAVASAGFKGTAVSLQSLGHLPSPLAECVVGGMWSGARVSRDALKEDLCVQTAGPGRLGQEASWGLCRRLELITNSAFLAGDWSGTWWGWAFHPVSFL